MRPFLATWALLALPTLVVACGDDAEDDARYYDGPDSAALGAVGNQATCATCHSIDGSSEGFSGTSLKDIAYRTSFKGGGAATLLDAANACVTGWMGGTALASSDEPWMALERYLKSISSQGVTAPAPLMPEVLANQAAYETAYAGGDGVRGEAKFRSTCGGCHSGGLVLGTRTSPSAAGLRGVTVGRIAQKVRTSGPPPSGTDDSSDTTPGPMPFFEPDELSAADLADIIAFVRR